MITIDVFVLTLLQSQINVTITEKGTPYKCPNSVYLLIAFIKSQVTKIMVTINEHPLEMVNRLTRHHFLKLSIRHNDLMITMTSYIKLGCFIDDEETSETTLPLNDNLIQSIHYLSYPRDYIIVHISALFNKDFVMDTKWHRIEPGWYIYQGVAESFPCSWKINAHHTMLVKYHVEQISEID